MEGLRAGTGSLHSIVSPYSAALLVAFVGQASDKVSRNSASAAFLRLLTHVVLGAGQGASVGQW